MFPPSVNGSVTCVCHGGAATLLSEEAGEAEIACHREYTDEIIVCCDFTFC